MGSLDFMLSELLSFSPPGFKTVCDARDKGDMAPPAGERAILNRGDVEATSRHSKPEPHHPSPGVATVSPPRDPLLPFVRNALSPESPASTTLEPDTQCDADSTTDVDPQRPEPATTQPRASSRRPPLMTPDQAEMCHLGGWSDAMVTIFLQRKADFMRSALCEVSAEELAERLVLRDRDGDDRVVCLECTNFSRGECLRSRTAGVGMELGMLSTTLQRCRAFVGRFETPARCDAEKGDL